MTGLQKLLALHSMRGGIHTQQATATGNRVEFSTTLAWPLVQCKVVFSPVQEGTGDPSIENVRPILGWEGVDVFHSGSDTSIKDTYNITWQTVGALYGGYVDLATGILVQTMASIPGDSWEYFRSSNGFKAYRCDSPPGRTSNLVNISNKINAFETFSSTNMTKNTIQYRTSDSAAYMALQEDVEPETVQFVYQLAEPNSYQLTAQQINAIAGANKIWSNANEDIEITYLKKG